jgi:hypothetical protein
MLVPVCALLLPLSTDPDGERPQAKNAQLIVW